MITFSIDLVRFDEIYDFSTFIIPKYALTRNFGIENASFYFGVL